MRSLAYLILAFLVLPHAASASQKDQLPDANAKLNLEPYQWDSLHALFPKPEKITALEKRGVNTALIVRDKGEDHFVKLWFTEEARKLGGDDDFLVQFASLPVCMKPQLLNSLRS